MATNDQILPTTAPEKLRDETASDSNSDERRTPRAQQSLDAQHLENAKDPWWPSANYGPLAKSTSNGERLPAFGGAFQPGLYKPPNKDLANPAPLGLAAFAFTTFLLSLINMQTRGLSAPNIIVGPAYAYGGLVQFLAGMWELGFNNTFGGWVLSSYGAFWISIGIIFTPGGFHVVEAYDGETAAFFNAFGLYLFGWFIFTFIVWLMTLKSTLAFSSLFVMVWLTFLCLATGYLYNHTANGATAPNENLIIAGGVFGILASFLAWWNMLAGILDKSNSFFLIPVYHFPWSEKGRARRENGADADPEKND